jgi:hypothetical protein
MEDLESFLSAHITRSGDAQDLGLLHDSLYPKATKLLTVKTAIRQSEPFVVLIDGGLELNLFLACLAKEQDLVVHPLLKLLANGVGGKAIKIYGTTLAPIRIVDSRGKEETQNVPFIVADIQRYPAYLGMP